MDLNGRTSVYICLAIELHGVADQVHMTSDQKAMRKDSHAAQICCDKTTVLITECMRK